jgi:hypothetical protein
VPKTSLELEIERIQAEKRALMKRKRKQDRLFAKIRQQQEEERMMRSINAQNQ